MKLNDEGWRILFAATIRQALADLSDPPQRDDAIYFLQSGDCQGMLAVICDKASVDIQAMNRHIACAIDIDKHMIWRIRQYARGHTLKETAEYFDILEDDLEFYATWQNIEFIK